MYLYLRPNEMTKSSSKRIWQKKADAAVDQQALHTINDAYTTGSFKYLRILVHILGSLQFTYAIYYQWFKVPWRQQGDENEATVKARWAGPFKFLTFLDVILQSVYHTVALLNDVFGSNDVCTSSSSLLRRARDFIFAAWAFPMAHNVAIGFWVIYVYDRELIFPATLDSIFPNWLNHIVHTNIAYLCILDLFTCFRQYPRRLLGATSTCISIFLYIVWMHVIHSKTDFWVYPIFNILNMPMRYTLLSLMAAFTVCCYLFGEFLNSVIWATELQLLKTKSKES